MSLSRGFELRNSLLLDDFNGGVSCFDPLVCGGIIIFLETGFDRIEGVGVDGAL